MSEKGILERALWRGKRIDNGEWVVGHLTKQRHSPKDPNYAPPYELQFVIDHEEKGVMLTSFINPATVGQCTGLRDKNGKLIFEGDIIKSVHPSPDVPKQIGVVKWHEYEYGWQWDTGGRFLDYIDYAGDMYEIIGNRWDNPELLHNIQQLEEKP